MPPRKKQRKTAREGAPPEGPPPDLAAIQQQLKELQAQMMQQAKVMYLSQSLARGAAAAPSV